MECFNCRKHCKGFFCNDCRRIVPLNVDKNIAKALESSQNGNCSDLLSAITGIVLDTQNRNINMGGIFLRLSVESNDTQEKSKKPKPPPPTTPKPK